MIKGGSNRLLLDPILARSPGAVRLHGELPKAVAQTRPHGWEVWMICYGDRIREVPVQGIQLLEVPRSGTTWHAQWWRLHALLPRIVERNQVDVVFSLSGYVTRALRSLCGTVITINNMLPFMPEISRVYGTALQLKWWIQRRQLIHSIRNSDSVLLHSQHALNRISAFAGDFFPRTRVVHSGVPAYSKIDPDNPPQHPYGGRPYYFYLSAIKRYKNHLNLIRGFADLVSQSPDAPDLIIAGFPVDRAYLSQILALISGLSLEGRVIYLGTLSDTDSKAWLHHAVANVFASTCETNSLVIAEVFGAGGVLLCSDCPPMPEIAANAADLFDPADPRAISRAMRKVWQDALRNRELRRLAWKRAEELSWTKCGEAIWSLTEAAKEQYKKRSHDS